MFGSMTYLIWLSCFIGLPLLVLWAWQGRVLLRRGRGLAWVVVGSLAGGWAWDALAVRIGVWTFDPAHLAGWWALGLPLEEWLWIVGVTLLFGSLTVIFAERLGVDGAGSEEG